MQKLKQLINVPLKKIRQQYNELFNTSNYPNSIRDREEESKLNELINEFISNKTDSDYIKIDKENVKSIINNLTNGKAVGFSGVSTEVLIWKYYGYKRNIEFYNGMDDKHGHYAKAFQHLNIKATNKRHFKGVEWRKQSQTIVNIWLIYKFIWKANFKWNKERSSRSWETIWLQNQFILFPRSIFIIWNFEISKTTQQNNLCSFNRCIKSVRQSLKNKALDDNV